MLLLLLLLLLPNSFFVASIRRNTARMRWC
jgi:hypothetical protein